MLETYALHTTLCQTCAEEVQFPGYSFTFSFYPRTYLQAFFTALCSKTSLPFEQATRKWYISSEATKSEIIQTMFKCVLTSVEHEARESFLYKGKPIFGPHFSVDALWNIAESLDERNPK